MALISALANSESGSSCRAKINTALASVDEGDVNFNIAKRVTAPTASADPGSLGEWAASGNFLYVHNGTEWLRYLGSQF